MKIKSACSRGLYFSAVYMAAYFAFWSVRPHSQRMAWFVVPEIGVTMALVWIAFLFGSGRRVGAGFYCGVASLSGFLGSFIATFSLWVSRNDLQYVATYAAGEIAAGRLGFFVPKVLFSFLCMNFILTPIVAWIVLVAQRAQENVIKEQ